MIKIIKEREKVAETHFRHDFHWEDDPNAGFTFSVDENGKLLPTNEAATENYRLCLSGQMGKERGFKIIDDGVRKITNTYTTNRIGLCTCGEEVELYDQYLAACECPKCGQWYNLSGQELKNPEHWGDLD